MKIVYFGTPEWAVPPLEAIASSSHRVIGVVTSPDAAVGRSRTPQPTPVKRAALALGLGPVLQPTTLKGDAVRSAILELAPDALVVVAYGRILPGRLLDATRHGAVNLHFSLLPRYRGASPVQHALLGGDPETGVTTMRMDRGLDTGPVLLQRATNVGARESSAGLGARLAVDGAALLVDTLDRLEAGTVTPRAQDERLAGSAPLLKREDGFVRWTDDAARLDRMIRAFDPWPPVVCRGPRGVLRLVAAAPAPEPAPPDAPAGRVLGRAGDAVDVAAGNGTRLRVQVLLPAGGKAMPGAAALAGRYLAPGDLLGDGAP